MLGFRQCKSVDEVKARLTKLTKIYNLLMKLIVLFCTILSILFIGTSYFIIIYIVVVLAIVYLKSLRVAAKYYSKYRILQINKGDIRYE